MSGLASTTRIIPLMLLVKNSVGFSLRQAISRAVSQGRLTALSRATDNEIGQFLIALNGKQSALGTIASRIAPNWEAVRQKALLRDPEHDGYAMNGARKESNELVVDVEALFSTLSSLQDIALRLTRVVERRVLRKTPQTTERELQALPGPSPAQRQMLKDTRDHFVHASMPWFEVVIPPGSHPDLAILLTKNPDYANGSGYVLLSDVGSAIPAVLSYLAAVEQYLVKQLDAHGI